MKFRPTPSHYLDWLICRLAQPLTLCCLVWSVSAAAVAAEPAGAADLDADPDLVGWWKFDETSGTTAADSSRHGRHGKLLGGVTFDEHSVSGRCGRALNLDDDASVCICDYKGITGNGPRTISAWIKTDTATGEIVSWGKEDFGQLWRFNFIRGRIGVTPHGGYYYMATDVHDNNWHHVAVVVRKAELPNLHDDVTLYLDGKIAEVDRIGLLDLWPIDTGSELDVVIGKRFKGSIDDLRIYARTLSEDEIQVLCLLAQ